MWNPISCQTVGDENCVIRCMCKTSRRRSVEKRSRNRVVLMLLRCGALSNIWSKVKNNSQANERQSHSWALIASIKMVKHILEKKMFNVEIVGIFSLADIIFLVYGSVFSGAWNCGNNDCFHKAHVWMIRRIDISRISADYLQETGVN